MNEFFALIDRLKYIDRWGLMHGVRTENVLEHSAQTAMLAHSLALLENKLSGAELNAERVALLGLYHEAAEALTGDLPTPVKYYNESITAAYKEIEHSAEQKICGSIPDMLKGELSGYIAQEKTETERKVVKAADKLAALIKCKQEINSGNREFAPAFDATLKSLKESNLKSVEYFLKELLPSFDLPIDTLSEGV